MDNVWFTVAVPATVGVATALYTTGGRAALARRAIKQELDIAKMLPSGRGRELIERMADDKTVLYAARWVGPQPLSRRQHLFLIGIAIAGTLLTWVGEKLLDSLGDHRWLAPVLILVMLVGLGAASICTALWLSLMYMAENAKTRSEIVNARRERLERHLQTPTAMSGDPDTASSNEREGP